MKYIEAQRVIERNLNLIGSIIEHNYLITDLLIVPIEEQSRKNFIFSYMLTKNSNKAILPYMNDDVVVWAINSEILFKNNCLIYKEIY